MPRHAHLLPTLLLLACGSNEDATGSSLSGMSSTLTPTTTDASTSGDLDTGTTTTPTTTASTTTTTTTEDTTDTGGFPSDTSTGTPEPDPFTPGHIFVVGFNDRLVFEYDAALNPITSWSHPSFDSTEGPAGMVFDRDRYLVVAAYDQFCVFSAPNQIDVCHPKITPQRTENVIFDIASNLYTTTSTGGTDEIHKYDEDYVHLATFNLPTGNLTGITCDPAGDLFVASQAGATSIVYKVDRDDLQVLDSFDVPGNAEGLQYGLDDNLFVALAGGVGIASVAPSSPPMTLGITADPGLLWPVPLTIDEAGNRYTGDFEDGAGAAPSDLYVFAPDGTIVASRVPSELHGPFGLVVAGNALPCGAVPPG